MIWDLSLPESVVPFHQGLMVGDLVEGACDFGGQMRAAKNSVGSVHSRALRLGISLGVYPASALAGW